MKPWIAALGITEGGVEKAEALLKKAVELVELAKELRADSHFIKGIIREAEFRVLDLPNRDPKWAKKYMKENE